MTATRRRSLVLVTVVALGLAVARDAAAGPATDQLRGGIDRVIGVLEDPGLKARPDARRAAIRTAASDIFDFTELTRRSMGRHWQTATPGERQQIAQLMAALLERSYIGRIEQYNGERITYLGEAADGDVATVRTRLVSRSGLETPVDYRLHRVGQRWMVYDLSVEGVSLVANYRAQFNRILQSGPTQVLVERLRAKQE